MEGYLSWRGFVNAVLRTSILLVQVGSTEVKTESRSEFTLLLLISLGQSVDLLYSESGTTRPGRSDRHWFVITQTQTQRLVQG